MMHPDTGVRLIDEQIGYGVLATSFIPRGTMVYVKDALEIEIWPDDPRLDDPRLADTIEKYSYIDERGVRNVCWDHGKYVNHACNPSTLSTGYGFEIALRDIKPGEEITDDYGIFNPTEAMELSCGEPNCRGMLRPDDFERCWRSWDRRIKQALRFYRDVPQPLAALLTPEIAAQLERYLTTGKSYRSIRTFRYQRATHPFGAATAAAATTARRSRRSTGDAMESRQATRAAR